jgi:hypothetical protein
MNHFDTDLRPSTEAFSWILITRSSLAMPLQPWNPRPAEPFSQSRPSSEQPMSIQDGSIWFNTTGLKDFDKQCP